MNQATVMRDEDLQTAFANYLLTEKRVSTNSFSAYTRDIAQLLLFFADQKLSLNSCERADLKLFLRFLRNNGISPKSLARKISSIKLLFGFLEERYQIENKSDALIYPKLDQKLPVYLTNDEVYTLLEVADQDVTPRGMRNKVIIHVLYATGMRVSELCGLSVNQIYFDTGFVQLMGKGNKQRMIPLPKATLQLLRTYLDDVHNTLVPAQFYRTHEYLFPTIWGEKVRPITRQSVWNILKELLTRAGITKNISPHSLRHSIATHLLNNGADIRSLQLLLGHENLNTIQMYTHLETTQLRAIYDAKHPRS